MKKLGILLLVVFGWGLFSQSCDDTLTYAEMKDEERAAIRRFLELEGIKVISEEQFEEQNSMTDVSENEFVLFNKSGVYLQIIDRGNGEKLEDGRHEILARYVEERIGEDGTTDTLTLNTYINAAHPDIFTVTVADDSKTATFSSGMMSSYHGSNYVPSAWLLPLDYLTIGREISGRSKFRVIVPHSEGTSTASSSVVPCFYEITYQLSR